MKLYNVTVKQYNTHGYIPTRPESFTVQATSLPVAAIRGIKEAMASSKRRGITALDVKIYTAKI